jgi:hypothetical protein
MARTAIRQGEQLPRRRRLGAPTRRLQPHEEDDRHQNGAGGEPRDVLAVGERRAEVAAGQDQQRQQRQRHECGSGEQPRTQGREAGRPQQDKACDDEGREQGKIESRILPEIPGF